ASWIGPRRSRRSPCPSSRRADRRVPPGRSYWSVRCRADIVPPRRCFMSKHEHIHTHAPVKHSHEHTHDDQHHGHTHPGQPAGTKHTHEHTHEGTTHAHDHDHDDHHHHDH